MVATDTHRAIPGRGAFGQGMLGRRTYWGYTQEDCAARAGISPQRWRQLELGYEDHPGGKPARPSAKTVRRIAYILDWPLTEAFEAAGMAFDPTEPPPPAEGNVKDRNTQVLQLLNSLPPAVQDSVVVLMESMQPRRHAEDFPKAS